MYQRRLQINSPVDVPIVIYHNFLKVAPGHAFLALTDPSYIEIWGDTIGYKVALFNIDPSVGGRYDIAYSDPSGVLRQASGEILEFQPPRCLVFTRELDVKSGEETLETLIFDSMDGGTYLTGISRYPSIEVRDRIANVSFMSFVANAFECLDEVVGDSWVVENLSV